MYNVTHYTSDTGKDYVDEEIAKLNYDMQDDVDAALKVLELYGHEANSHLLNIKHLRGKILEIKLRDFRILFAFQKNKEIVLLHAFVKKRNKTDNKDIELAEKRLRQLRR